MVGWLSRVRVCCDLIIFCAVFGFTPISWNNFFFVQPSIFLEYSSSICKILDLVGVFNCLPRMVEVGWCGVDETQN